MSLPRHFTLNNKTPALIDAGGSHCPSLDSEAAHYIRIRDDCVSVSALSVYTLLNCIFCTLFHGLWGT